MACFLSSPKLAACAADLSSHYPDSALGFGAVCHLIVSALVCWPVYGWIPGLFHTLLSGVQTSSVPALGPKETCSFLCILVWKNLTLPLIIFYLVIVMACTIYIIERN